MVCDTIYVSSKSVSGRQLWQEKEWENIIL